MIEAWPPVEVHKGTAVRRLAEEYRPERAVFLGDDATDLDAFRALETPREKDALRETLRVGVANPEGTPEITTKSGLVVEGAEGAEDVLRALLS